MAHFNDPMLKSEVCEVRFAGWRSTTLDLQRAGWKLAAHEEQYRREITLVMELPKARLRLAARSRGYRGIRPRHSYDLENLPIFEVQHCASDLIESVPFSFDGFDPIDAKPQLTTQAPRKISDMHFFASPLVRTEEIIVEPQTVAECLEIIRKMQAPDLAKIRERNRRRDAGEPMNQEIFHAQILSLAA